MKTDNTTPRPWKVRTGINEAFIDGGGIVCVAVVNSLTDTKEAETNANLICQAVNNHDKLLGAISTAIYELRRLADRKLIAKKLQEAVMQVKTKRRNC